MNRVSFGSKSLDPINSPWANVIAELDHSKEMIFLLLSNIDFFLEEEEQQIKNGFGKLVEHFERSLAGPECLHCG